MTSNTNVFHVVDYIVFAATLLISLGIGVFHACTGGKQRTTNEYLMADRHLKLLPTAVSILVSYVSAISFIGTPAEMYAYGTQFSFVFLAAIMGTSLGALMFVPLYYPLHLTSVFEYLELRFKSKAPKIVGDILQILNQLLYVGVCVFAPAVALAAVTGFPTWVSMVVCVLTATLYTTMGGMKAVIWADVFQAIIMFVGMFALVIMGTIKVGGPSEVGRLNSEWGRLTFFNLSPDPTERATFWSVSFVMCWLFFAFPGTQPMVQRYVALPDMQTAFRSVMLTIPGHIITLFLTCSAGVVAFAYYAKVGCDPYAAGYIYNENQILPYFVLDVFAYPGFPGLFLACLASAALSSVSSSLNSMGAILWKDLFAYKFVNSTDATQANITKAIVLFSGLGALACAFIIQTIKGTLVQIAFAFAGASLGPMVGIAVLGASWTRVNALGAVVAAICSVSWTYFLSIGAILNKQHSTPLPSPTHSCQSADNFTISSTLSTPYSEDVFTYSTHTLNGDDVEPGINTLFAISYLYYPGMGIAICLIVGILLSFIPGFREKEEVPDKLLFPHVRVLRRWLGYSPKDAHDKDSTYKQPLDKLSSEEANSMLATKQNSMLSSV